VIKIIAFKSDRLGDLMLFSPCLKIIKDNIKDAHITLVCSEFNYQIAKNYEYVDKFIILKKNIIGLLLKNFKYFFLTKYKYLFQFDGKNSSYLISYFIKSKIKETGAALGGEMSGHIFFNERWYGFDDAIYTGARLLEILSKTSQTCEQVFADLPNNINTPTSISPICKVIIIYTA